MLTDKNSYQTWFHLFRRVEKTLILKKTTTSIMNVATVVTDGEPAVTNVARSLTDATTSSTPVRLEQAVPLLSYTSKSIGFGRNRWRGVCKGRHDNCYGDRKNHKRSHKVHQPSQNLFVLMAFSICALSGMRMKAPCLQGPC